MQIALIEFLKGRWSWRWVFPIVAVLILASTAVYAFMRPNLYRSETRILVEPEEGFGDKLTATETRDSLESRIHDIQQLLESRSIRERIVTEFRIRASDTSIPIEDAIESIRINFDVSRTSGNAFTMAYSAPDPRTAQAILQRIAEILIQSNQNARKMKAEAKYQFLERELYQAESYLEAMDEQIARFKASHLGEPQIFREPQALLRTQARLQRHADEIAQMKFNAQMAVNFLSDRRYDIYRILDEASLPERPISPTRAHILLMGIVAGLVVALPAAFLEVKTEKAS